MRAEYGVPCTRTSKARPALMGVFPMGQEIDSCLNNGIDELVPIDWADGDCLVSIVAVLLARR